MHKLLFLYGSHNRAALKVVWRAPSLQFLLFPKLCSFLTALELFLSIPACLSGRESGGDVGGVCQLAQAKSSFGKKPGEEGPPPQVEMMTQGSQENLRKGPFG